MYVQQSSLEDGIPGLFMIPPTEDALVGFFFDMFNGKKITMFCHTTRSCISAILLLICERELNSENWGERKRDIFSHACMTMCCYCKFDV